MPEMHDPALIDRWVDDTVDLIEFANGGTDTEWGAKRAALGHPEPFGLDMIGLGNEENKPDVRGELPRSSATPSRRSTRTSRSSPTPARTRRAPASTTSGTSTGPEGRPGRRALLQRPDWFLDNNHRYDSYDRNGPKIFLGEYASRGNTLYNALSEASYMTGLQRNADVVRLASYAPLLANESNVQWTPDAIWFDNDESWTRPTGRSRSCSATTSATRSCRARSTARPPPGADLRRVFLSTWATSAAYDNVTVTADGRRHAVLRRLLRRRAAWTPQRHRIVVHQDGGYVQSSTTAQNTHRHRRHAKDWSNYTLELDATKLAGSEGFLVGFGAKATETSSGGTSAAGTTPSPSSKRRQRRQDERHRKEHRDPDRPRIRHPDRGHRAHGQALPGQVLWGTVDDTQADPVYSVVTKDTKSGDTIVKVVNTKADKTPVDIRVAGAANISTTAAVTTLTQTADGQNLTPASSTFNGAGAAFTYEFEPKSVTFIRLAAARK